MIIADVRRGVLRAIITHRFGGVARQCALAIGKPEGQINDMLSTPPRKSFGEKIARQFEQLLDLQNGYFDDPKNCIPEIPGSTSGEQNAKEPSITPYEITALVEKVKRLTPEAARMLLPLVAWIADNAIIEKPFARQNSSNVRLSMDGSEDDIESGAI